MARKTAKRDSDTNSSESWTLLDVDELVNRYWNEVAPALKEDGFDPTSDRPTHRWLSANGYRGLVYTLRRYHDRSFGEFWSSDLGLDSNSSYDWGTTHGETLDLLEAFLESRRDRANLSESSIDTLRYRLKRYVSAYSNVNSDDDLISPVSRGNVKPYQATEWAWRAVDELNDQLSSITIRRIHEAVSSWYDYLVRRKRAEFNPVEGIDEEYGWSHKTKESNQTENLSLSADHVKTLYNTASDTQERLLIVGLCAWGLRTSEVASLHQNQLTFDVDTPYISFSDRKNGPGEVSMLYGRPVVEERLIEFSDQDTWNGYLFPSTRSRSGHICRQTIGNWFDDLVDRADLPPMNGSKPVPKMARRFWYDRYTSTLNLVLEHVGEVAAEQGSTSAEVVMRDYLSPSRRRQLRRTHMRELLATAFEN